MKAVLWTGVKKGVSVIAAVALVCEDLTAIGGFVVAVCLLVNKTWRARTWKAVIDLRRGDN